MTGIHKLFKTQKGFTLVELLITVALFTIIVSISVGIFTNALRTQRQVASLISAQSNISVALEQMTRQIRTGYLFCHAPGSGIPTSCGHCTILDSRYEEPGLPGDIGNDLPEWFCSELDYYNAEGTHVHYAVSANDVLTESDNNGPAVDITSDNVKIKYLSFMVFGGVEGDHWTPRISIAIGIVPSSTDPGVSSDVFPLETTVSARSIDCSTVGSTTSC